VAEGGQNTKHRRAIASSKAGAPAACGHDCSISEAGAGTPTRPPRAAAVIHRLGCSASVRPSRRRSTSSSVVCRCGEIRSDGPRTAAKQDARPRRSVPRMAIAGRTDMGATSPDLRPPRTDTTSGTLRVRVCDVTRLDGAVAATRRRASLAPLPRGRPVAARSVARRGCCASARRWRRTRRPTDRGTRSRGG
jgi:hypothetical protein